MNRPGSGRAEHDRLRDDGGEGRVDGGRPDAGAMASPRSVASHAANAGSCGGGVGSAPWGGSGRLDRRRRRGLHRGLGRGRSRSRGLGQRRRPEGHAGERDRGPQDPLRGRDPDHAVTSACLAAWMRATSTGSSCVSIATRRPMSSKVKASPTSEANASPVPRSVPVSSPPPARRQPESSWCARARRSPAARPAARSEGPSQEAIPARAAPDEAGERVVGDAERGVVGDAVQVTPCRA